MELIFIRHGQTNLNYEGVYQGRVNIGLNNKGEGQINKVSNKIKNFKIDKVYTSPLIRTVQTVEIIIKNNNIDLEIKHDKRIMEIDFGLWDTLPYDKVMIGYEKEYNEFLSDYKNFTFPGGESFEDFYNRCVDFISEITKEPSDESILIVAHGGVIRVFLLYLLGLKKEMFYNFSVKQGCYTRVLVYDGINVIDEINK